MIQLIIFKLFLFLYIKGFINIKMSLYVVFKSKLILIKYRFKFTMNSKLILAVGLDLKWLFREGMGCFWVQRH